MVPSEFVLAIVELAIVVAFALVAIGVKALDRAGFLASVAVGYPIFLGGGWIWFVIIAAFFVLGVGFTWYRYEYKKTLGGAQEKGGTRSWPNILANGGVAAIFGLCELLLGGRIFAALFLGAISAAAADTAATELGLLSHSTPRLITNLRVSVTPGISGGVTTAGFLGSALASAVIGCIAAALRMISGINPIAVLPIAVLGGIAGSVVDSFSGALIQRKGICVVCGVESESNTHHGRPVKYESGVSFVDNNIVNVIATIAGAAVSLLVASLFL